MGCLSVEEAGHSAPGRPAAAPQKRRKERRHSFSPGRKRRERLLFFRSLPSSTPRAPLAPQLSVSCSSRQPEGSSRPRERRRRGRAEQRSTERGAAAAETMAAAKAFLLAPSSIDARRRRRKSKQSKSTFDLLKQSSPSSHTNTLTCRCPRRPGRGGGRRGLPPCRGRWRGATWLRSRGVGFFKKRRKEKSGEEPVQERRFDVFVVQPRPSLSLFFFSFLLLSSPRQRSSFPFSFYVCFVLQVGWRSSLFFLKISIVLLFKRGGDERERASFLFCSLPILLPSPPSLPPLFHHTSHRGSRLSLASSHLVIILPNGVFFSGARSASTCAIGECDGSSREDQPSRTSVVTSTAQMCP